MLLGQEIYKVMDQKQIEVQQVGLNKMTDFAIHTLMELAKAFNYHRGNIPVDPALVLLMNRFALNMLHGS